MLLNERSSAEEHGSLPKAARSSVTWGLAVSQCVGERLAGGESTHNGFDGVLKATVEVEVLVFCPQVDGQSQGLGQNRRVDVTGCLSRWDGKPCL